MKKIYKSPNCYIDNNDILVNIFGGDRAKQQKFVPIFP